MFTITICPLCSKDFMFHGTDHHLYKEDIYGVYVICQDCYKKEQEKKQKKKDSNGSEQNLS